MPKLQSSPHSYSKESAGRGEFEGGDTALEREVVDNNPALEVRQDCAAIFVNGQ